MATGRAPDDPVAAFLDTLAAAPSRVLLLDYDGTLAPFRVERDQAVPYPGVREAVRGLMASGRTRVAVISGRHLADLRPLLAVEPPPELWGSHGWERIEPGGALRVRELPAATAAALREAGRALAAPGLAGRVETKPTSIAVHVRGLPAPDAERMTAAVRTAWEALAGDGSLAVHAFDGGIELRASGWDKGDAVRSVLDAEPPGTAVAYLGDDATDEDAFRALDALAADGRVRRLGVLVRAERRESTAGVRLEPPGQLLDFLQRWHRAAG